MRKLLVVLPCCSGWWSPAIPPVATSPIATLPTRNAEAAAPATKRPAMRARRRRRSTRHPRDRRLDAPRCFGERSRFDSGTPRTRPSASTPRPSTPPWSIPASSTCRRWSWTRTCPTLSCPTPPEPARWTTTAWASAAGAYCLKAKCVGCKTNSQCNNDKGVPFCSAQNTCVSCAAVSGADGGSACPAATPACAASGGCVPVRDKQRLPNRWQVLLRAEPVQRAATQ